MGLPLSFELVRWIRKHKNVQEISVGEFASVKTDEDKIETIFNRNMDEIVYFFEKTKVFKSTPNIYCINKHLLIVL